MVLFHTHCELTNQNREKETNKNEKKNDKTGFSDAIQTEKK